MDATTHGELEIGLHRWNIDSYSAELHVCQDEASNGTSSAPEIHRDIVDIPVLRGIQFDFDALRANALESVAYGQALAASLIADPRLQTAFTFARTRAQERNQKVRVRLFIDRAAVTDRRRETGTPCRSLPSPGGRGNNEPRGVIRPKPKLRQASGLLAKRQVK
jgi:hypothetical protein